MFICLLFFALGGTANAQNGLVPFDYPNEPFAEFQFDLDRKTIALVMEDTDPDITALFNALNALHLRNYKARHLDKMLDHYGTNLKIRGWSALEKSSNFHLYTRTRNATVIGIFILLKSGEAVYLINMDGQFAPKQVSQLIGNLNQLGIEIPELNAFGARSNTVSPSTLLRTPEGDPIHEVRIQANRETIEPQIRTTLEEGPDELIAAIATLRNRLPGIQTLTVRMDTAGGKRIATISVTAQLEAKSVPTASVKQFRTSEGDPIHEVRIRGNQQITETQIQTALESGPEDITEAIANLPLPDLNRVILEIVGDDTKRIATISVIAQPDTKNVLISAATRFRTAAGDPIHEVRIQGNQQITEAEIQTALEYGSEEIGEAVDNLRVALPYFSQVMLQFENDGTRRVAIITVVEKKLSSNYYLHAVPLVRFNRVTGWQPAALLELGRRRQMGPLWMWGIPSSMKMYLTKVSGNVGYGFGNQHLNYRVRGDITWGQPDISNMGISAQIYRATDLVAPNLLPYHDNFLTTWANLWGGSQLHNYYLNKGVEMSFRWEPVGQTHSLKLMIRAESHDSLQKTTDWYFGNWSSKIEARANPPITPGRLRSVTLRYDLNTRINSHLGWHNTLFVEHSNSAVGSDFDFTRLQLHLRYAVSKGNNPIRTRLALGAATGTLPVQHQFVLGGTGTLNGYPPYAFSGTYGALLNIEYLYRLSHLYHWGFLKEMFAVLFLDQGQVWSTSDKPYRFDPKTSVGIGLQSGEDYVFRLNLSKNPLNPGGRLNWILCGITVFRRIKCVSIQIIHCSSL